MPSYLNSLLYTFSGGIVIVYVEGKKPYCPTYILFYSAWLLLKTQYIIAKIVSIMICDLIK